MDSINKLGSSSCDPASGYEVTNVSDDGSGIPNRNEVDGLENANGDGNSLGVVSNSDASFTRSQDAEAGEDGNLNATEDSGNPDEAELSEEKCLNADADSDLGEGNSSADAEFHADEEMWSADEDSHSDEDSDSDEENLSADVDSNLDEEILSVNADEKDRKDWTDEVYAYLPTAGVESRKVKIVLTAAWELIDRGQSHYKSVYDCYYDLSKGYNDRDTGYYDLDFEGFTDKGGSFLNSHDARFVVHRSTTGSTVLLNGRQPNLRWARGFPAHVDSAGGSSGEDDQYVTLEENIWKFLPEEVVFRILLWLSPAAQSRFRCVCSKWKAVLSNGTAFLDNNVEGRTLSCTVKSNARARHVSAYCHGEKKWFDLPCIVAVRILLVNRDDMPTHARRATSAIIQTDNRCDKESLLRVMFRWELVDVEGELFCYASKDTRIGDEEACTWVAVCNPMIPESSLLLPPPSTELGANFKLLVNRQNKTFKVVSLSIAQVTIFDSISFQWAVVQLPMELEDFSSQFFFRNGIVYGLACYRILFVLDMASRAWNEVEVEFPCTTGRNFAIKSCHDQVMLVEVNPKEKEYVRVWKLLTDAANNVPLFSYMSWEKQKIALPRSLKALVWHFRECWLSGSQFLFFNGGQTNQWIQYDFSRRTWCVMPSRGRRIAHLSWFEWEPGFNMDLKPI